MILRTWHGWTTRDNADSYQQLLDTTIAPAIIARQIPGLRSLDILRHADGGTLAQRVYIHQLPPTAPRAARLIEGGIRPGRVGGASGGAKSERRPGRRDSLMGYAAGAFPHFKGYVAGTGFEPPCATPPPRPNWPRGTRQLRGRLAELIIKRYAHHQTSPPMPPEHLAALALATDAGLFLQYSTEPGALPWELHADAMVQLLDPPTRRQNEPGTTNLEPYTRTNRFAPDPPQSTESVEGRKHALSLMDHHGASRLAPAITQAGRAPAWSR